MERRIHAKSTTVVTTSLARFRQEVGPDFLSLSPPSVDLDDAAQLFPLNGGAAVENAPNVSAIAAAEVVHVAPPAKPVGKRARAVGEASRPPSSRPRIRLKMTTSNDDVAMDMNALVVYDNAAAAAEPIDAVPLQALPPPPPPQPAWIRGELLPSLGLRGDIPLHFICRKRVEFSDLSTQQSRFLIPSDAAVLHLRPLLSADERLAANLVEENLHKEKKPRKPTGEEQQHDGEKKPRKTGKKDPGLVVHVVVYRAVDVMAMEMTRRGSNGHTIIRQRENTRFVDRGVRVMDDVVVWAFRPEANAALCFVIANTADEQQQQQPPSNALPQQQQVLPNVLC